MTKTQDAELIELTAKLPTAEDRLRMVKLVNAIERESEQRAREEAEERKQ